MKLIKTEFESLLVDFYNVIVLQVRRVTKFDNPRELLKRERESTQGHVRFAGTGE
jgi:hypothetical protein